MKVEYYRTPGLKNKEKLRHCTALGCQGGYFWGSLKPYVYWTLLVLFLGFVFFGVYKMETDMTFRHKYMDRVRSYYHNATDEFRNEIMHHGLITNSTESPTSSNSTTPASNST